MWRLSVNCGSILADSAFQDGSIFQHSFLALLFRNGAIIRTGVMDLDKGM